MEEAQLPVELPPYNARELTGSRRAGIRYKAYSPEDFEAAMRAVREEGMSLRKASISFNVPKTTLADKLGDSCPNLPPLQATRKNRIATRYTWTEAEMEQAIAAVQTGVHASDAARQFGVPYSNLNARSRGRPEKDLKTDLARLSLKQENLLVDWAHAQCELGFPPTKDQIYELADKTFKKQHGDEKSLGKQWVGHWLRRHPHIRALDWAPKPTWKKRPSKSFVSSAFEAPDETVLEPGDPPEGADLEANHDAAGDIPDDTQGEGELAGLVAAM